MQTVVSSSYGSVTGSWNLVASDPCNGSMYGQWNEVMDWDGGGVSLVNKVLYVEAGLIPQDSFTITSGTAESTGIGSPVPQWLLSCPEGGGTYSGMHFSNETLGGPGTNAGCNNSPCAYYITLPLKGVGSQFSYTMASVDPPPYPPSPWMTESPDGSLTYFDYTGAFTMTVTAYDVSIVPSVGPPSFSQNPTIVGDPVTMSVSVTGGVPPYTQYTWNGLPPGCGPKETETYTLTCAPSETGSYPISVTVLDSAGTEGTGPPATLDVISSIDVTLDITNSSGFATYEIYLGETVQFTAVVTGSTAYTIDWIQEPPGCTDFVGVTVTCTPSTVGDRQPIVVEATDIVTDQTSSDTGSIDVDPVPLDVTIGFQYDNVTGGGILTAYVMNGAPPYTYSWDALPPTCLNEDSYVISCTGPIPADDYDVYVNVTDSMNEWGDDLLSFTINPGEIVFVEQGLNSSATWTVILNSRLGIFSQSASAGDPIDFDNLPTTAGTYLFLASGPKGYTAIPRSGAAIPGGVYRVKFMNTMPVCTPVHVTLVTNSTTTATQSTTKTTAQANNAVKLGVCNGIKPSQISNATIYHNANGTSSVSFEMTGKPGTSASPVIVVPMSAVSGGRAPTVYVNGTLVPSSYFVNATCFFVWFETHFSTDGVSFVFAAQPYYSSNATATTGKQGGGTSMSYEILAGGLGAVVLVMVLVAIIVTRRRHPGVVSLPTTAPSAGQGLGPGTSRPPATYCRFCGQPISSKAAFCNQCGKRVE